MFLEFKNNFVDVIPGLIYISRILRSLVAMESPLVASLVIPTCSTTFPVVFSCLVDIHDDWYTYGLLNHTYACPFLT